MRFEQIPCSRQSSEKQKTLSRYRATAAARSLIVKESGCGDSCVGYFREYPLRGRQERRVQNQEWQATEEKRGVRT